MIESRQRTAKRSGPGRQAAWSTGLLTIWISAVVYVTWPSFRWQIEYFRTPGHSYFLAILAAAPIGALLALLYSRLRGPGVIRWEPALLLAPLFVVLLRQPWGSLVGLLLLSAALGLGQGILRLLRLGSGEWALSVMLGASVVAWVFSAFAAAGYLSRVLLIGSAAALGVLGLGFAPQALRLLRDLSRQWTADSQGASRVVGLFAPFLGLYGLSAAFLVASPPTSHDAVNFHLPLALRWIETGGMTPAPNHPYSYFPQLYELLTSWAIAAGSGPSAKVFSCLLSLVGFGLCWRVCRLLRFNSATALVAVTLLTSAPAIHWTAAVLKNDFLMVSFQIASLVCFLLWSRTRNARWILLAVWLTGSSFGVKHSALFGAVGLGTLFLYAWWRQGRPWRVAVLAVAILACTASVWHWRAYSLTGDPAHPERSRLAGRIVRPEESRFLELRRIPSTIWVAHLEGHKEVFENVLRAPVGILLTLALPLPLLLRRRGDWSADRKAVAVAALLALVYWVMTVAKIRYGIAGLMFLTPLAAAAFVRIYDEGSPLRRALLTAGVLYGLVFGWTGILIIENSGPQLRYVAGLVERDDYVASVQPATPALRELSGIAGPDDNVIAADCCVPYYYSYSWKLDCFATRTTREDWVKIQDAGPPPAYDYLVRAPWISPETLGFDPHSAIVYQDRACVVHRLSPPQLGDFSSRQPLR